MKLRKTILMLLTTFMMLGIVGNQLPVYAQEYAEDTVETEDTLIVEETTGIEEPQVTPQVSVEPETSIEPVTPEPTSDNTEDTQDTEESGTDSEVSAEPETSVEPTTPVATPDYTEVPEDTDESQVETEITQDSNFEIDSNNSENTVEQDLDSYLLTSWSWVDEQGYLSQTEAGWVLALPGVNETNPVSKDELLNNLPKQINATNQKQETIPLDVSWNLSSIPEEGVTEGEYTLNASLNDSKYSFNESTTTLSVMLQLGGAEQYFSLPKPDGSPTEYKDYEVNGISPNGTKIDLFDYWIDSQTTADTGTNTTTEFLGKGINADHALLFGNGMNKNPNGIGAWNQWTGDASPRQGIVNTELGLDGYPRLNVTTNGQNAISGRDGQESLAYLFDPNYSCNGKVSYSDVKGLLQVDENGYYYYNSQQNYAVFREDINSFTLYDHPGIKAGGSSPDGQFFPFTDVNNVPTSSEGFMNNEKSSSDKVNHYFGLHMSTRFIQQNDGYTAAEGASNRQPVTYTFSGDDDVWIYIDGTLVADLGGIHDMASVSINFATGLVTINKENMPGYRTYYLREKLNLNGNTLPNNTYHTLDFFYLERGNVDSNMNLRYNLVTIPESSLIKVDQLGNPIEGAEFALLTKTDYDKLEIDEVTGEPKEDAITDAAVAIGTTDRYGEFVFTKRPEAGEGESVKKTPITINELYAYLIEEIGPNKPDPADDKVTDYVLVETRIPEGYRSNGITELYFYKTSKDEILLLSNSVWDKGTYAMAKVTATAPNTIRSANDDSKTVTLIGPEAIKNPLMFAVVYKKVTNGDTTEWRPVYGNPLDGWTVAEDDSWSSVITAAKEYPYIFQLASSGSYQVEISNLPGDIKTYYHITGNEDTAEYATGYYYTTASTVDQANERNTWRIDSDPTESNDSVYALSRVFSVDLYVPNIQNRLLVQKVDDQSGDDKQTVSGAIFSLYKEDQVILSGGVPVGLKDDAVAYDTVTTQDLDREINDGENDTDPDIMNLKGGGIFPSKDGKPLVNGVYYLVETETPYGYKKNDTIIPVIVDETGVYVDAGNDQDGVSVLRGVGSIVKSMVQFAADDHVDSTLNGIKANLISGTWDNNGFQWETWNDNEPLHLQYLNNNGLLDYGLYEKNEDQTQTYELEGDVADVNSLTKGTETGWSKLLIRQCLEHNDSDSYKQNLETIDITALFSGTVTVRVENERTVDLKITKKVEQEGQVKPPGNQTFEFNLTLLNVNVPITGDYSITKSNDSSQSIKFESDGKASFSLMDNESIVIHGLPVGTAYSLDEASKAGFSTTVDPTGNGFELAITDGAHVNGSIPHTTVEQNVLTLNYANTFDGSAHVTLSGNKTLLGRNLMENETYEFILIDEANDSGTIFDGEKTATVVGDNTSNSKDFSFEELTFTQIGTYKFIIKEKMPSGVSTDNPFNDGVLYDTHETTVTVVVNQAEDTNVLGIESITYNNGTSSSNTQKAQFVNVWSGLTVTKTVTGTMGDRDKDFTFSIVSSSENVNGNYQYVVKDGGTITSRENLVVLDGKGTFTLKHGQSIEIYGLPQNSTWTINELNATDDGYRISVSNDDDEVDDSSDTEGNVTIDQTTKHITFTNTRDNVPVTGFIDDHKLLLFSIVTIAIGGGLFMAIGNRRKRRYIRH